jgi:hypothetical protein
LKRRYSLGALSAVRPGIRLSTGTQCIRWPPGKQSLNHPLTIPHIVASITDFFDVASTCQRRSGRDCFKLSHASKTASSRSYVQPRFLFHQYFLYHIPDNPQKSMCQMPDLACAEPYHTSWVSQLIDETSVTSQATFACHMAFRFSDLAYPALHFLFSLIVSVVFNGYLVHIYRTLGYSHG